MHKLASTVSSLSWRHYRSAADLLEKLSMGIVALCGLAMPLAGVYFALHSCLTRSGQGNAGCRQGPLEDTRSSLPGCMPLAACCRRLRPAVPVFRYLAAAFAIQIICCRQHQQHTWSLLYKLSVCSLIGPGCSLKQHAAVCRHQHTLTIQKRTGFSTFGCIPC